VLRAGPNIPARTGNPRAGHTAWYRECACGRVVLFTRDQLTNEHCRTYCGCRYLSPALDVPPAADARPREPLVIARVRTASQARDRVHDAPSPLGRLRRVSWPVDDDEGCVRHDKDPWTD